MRPVVAGTVCALAVIVGGCSGAEAETNQLVEAPEGLATAPALSGKFLHLSDIHFNVFADGMITHVAGLPPDQWKAQFEKYAKSSAPSTGHRDTNYSLLISALDAAVAAQGPNGKYDYILYTGDYLPHGFGYGSTQDQQSEFASNVVEFVNLMIADRFPGVPIVAALGNNDGGCGDYNLHPKEDFLADLGPDMPGLSSTAETDFVASGNYAIPHPTVPGTDFVVLSSYWSRKYAEDQHPCTDITDDYAPGTAQANWLGTTLGSGASPGPASRPAILLMHIPPGRDGYDGNWQWHQRFQTAFEDKLGTATRPLLGAFAGHSHMDEFRVVSDQGQPVLAVRIAPSVTTWNGNAPSFTVGDYDTNNGQMTDYEVHSCRTPGTGGQCGWSWEYRFSSSYNSKFTPTDLLALATSIQDPADPKDMRKEYRTYYSAKDRLSAESNWQKVVCAISLVDEVAYNKCRKRLGDYS
ncbi:metallophosphoesterase [Parerythrobacter aestuarii]|uniref:metallophosphoesterase n=1 Tax=Parerythrobacter aestuarii TaxID=3020909 RepID=UPI0024DE75AC|nr:metallophosphoesterase [Parerythrobacter aestuarii]